MLSVFSGLQAAELFVVASDSGGEGVEGGAEGGDLVGEAGEGAAGSCAVAVFLDDGAEGGVAVKGGAAQAGAGGDRGEGDRLAVVAELGAGALDAAQGGGGGHPAWVLVIRVSNSRP